MSRSNNTEIVNPCKKWFEWSGSKGLFQYWDKELEKRVEVPLPFYFLVLDTLTTITGYNEKEEVGYYSNEIRDIKKEVLVVKSKNGVEWRGLYDDIKDALKAKGGKFAQSMYVMIQDGEEYIIANIKVTGSSLAGGKSAAAKDVEVPGWMEFRNKNRAGLMLGAVAVKSTIECKKGANLYKVPNFEFIKDIKANTQEVAQDLDKELQGYLSQYFKVVAAQNVEAVAEKTIEQQVNEAHKAKFGDDPFATDDAPPEDFFVDDEKPIDNSQSALYGDRNKKEEKPEEDSQLPF